MSKTLPTAKDAEQQVIGAMLMEPPLLAEVSKQLHARDFHDPCNQAAFATMLAMHGERVPIDAVSVKLRLSTSDVFVKVSYPPAAYLLEAGEAVTTIAHCDYYVGLVAEASRKRRLHEFGSYIAEAACNGKASREIICSVGATFEDLQRDFTDDEDIIDSVPLCDFIAQDHKVEFLIENVITAGQPGVIAARSKSQKTTIGLDAAISIATGRKFLGKYWVPEAKPCGMISAESGGATLSESFARIANSKDVFVNAINNLHVTTEMPPLKTPKGRDVLERWIDRHELRCVFIDPTYKALPGVDDTQLSKMSEHLFPISDIVDRTGCSIVMVHHNRKSPAVQGKHYTEPTIEDIQGTGYQQWARFFLLLNKRREWDATTGQHWLWFKTEGSAGFGSRYFLDVHEGRRSDPDGRVWDVELSEPSEGAARDRETEAAQQEAEKMEADRTAVCRVLAEHPGGMTKTKAKNLSGVSGRRWPTVLETMFDEGDIDAVDVTVSNHKTPRDGIKLATTEAA